MKHFKSLALLAVASIAMMTSCQTTPVAEGDYDNYPVYKGDDCESKWNVCEVPSAGCSINVAFGDLG